MNEDFSDILNKFSGILKDKDIDLSSIVGGEKPPTNDEDFSFDIDTILKIKNIMGSMNKNKDNPRNKLLYSLEPYLENTKKEKLEQYMKIANLLSVLEIFDNENNKEFSENNYDFILIVILFLMLF